MQISCECGTALEITGAELDRVMDVAIFVQACPTCADEFRDQLDELEEDLRQVRDDLKDAEGHITNLEGG